MEGYNDANYSLTSIGFAISFPCSSFCGRGGVGPLSESPPLSDSLEFLLLSEILRGESE